MKIQIRVNFQENNLNIEGVELVSDTDDEDEIKRPAKTNRNHLDSDAEDGPILLSSDDEVV